MRLTRNTMKGKTVYRFLELILAVGMVMSLFPAIGRAEASSVTKVSITSNTITNATSYGIQGYDAYTGHHCHNQQYHHWLL